MKKSLTLIMILLIGIIGIELYVCFTKKFDDAFKNNNLDITRNPLDYGYLKTVNNNNFFRDEAFVKDIEHVIDEIETETDKELIKEYTLSINGKINKLIATYTVNNDEVIYTLKYGDKIVENDPYYFTHLDEEVDDKDYTISEFKEMYSDYIFDAKHLMFFKGDDNKDYIFMFDILFDEWKSDISGYVYNDEFDKLVVNIDGEQKDTWAVLPSIVSFANLKVYQKNFGYRTKMDIFNYEEEHDFLINLVENKLRFLKLINGEKYVRKFREYELIINDSIVDVKIISDYDVYLSTSVAF